VPPSDAGPADAPSAASDPLLSIVLTGRNDGHGGDFVSRFLRALRFNHRELVSRGIGHEVVFVEWAPPAGAPLLIDRLLEAAPEIDPAVCSWYVVDGRYQEALSQNPRLRYLEFLAKNAGVRRARGAYVLATNCDVYLGRQVVDALAARRLRPRVLYRAPRHDIKLTVDQSSLDWEILEDPRNVDGEAYALKPPYMGSGTGDFVLLDRESFHAMRGFNEVYRVARIGIDRNVLVKALSSGFAIEDIGGPVYHVNHVGSYRVDGGAWAGRESEAPWGDRRWHASGVSYLNPRDWGLARAPERRLSGQVVRLDFDWEAVPDLVDLRRVVAPVAREGLPRPAQYVRKR
jgi:hypothetical protein